MTSTQEIDCTAQQDEAPAPAPQSAQTPTLEQGEEQGFLPPMDKALANIGLTWDLG